MKRIANGRTNRFAILIGFVALCLPLCSGQTFLPQIADGSNWYTAVELINTTTSAATASLSFFQDTSNGATVAWNPPFLEVSSTQNLSVPAGGTLYIHTAGTAASLTQGWGEVTGASGIVAYAIYTYESFSGRPNQDGTSQAVVAATRILVPFDATAGYATGVAIVNPTSSAEAVSVNIQTDDGTVSSPSFPMLPANGQLAFNVATQFPSVVGHRGLAEFYVSSGGLSTAAFRFNPTLALTSLPVVLASGPPIIGESGTVSGPTAPYTSFSIAPLLFQPVGSALGNVTILLAPNPGSVTYTATVNAGSPSFAGGTFTNQGLAFSADTLQAVASTPPYGIFEEGGDILLVSGASLNFTLTPTLTEGSTREGNLMGTLVVTGTPYPSGGDAVTLSGSITGIYSAQVAP